MVNPLIAEMVKPYAKRVEVVTSGFDAARFPWPEATLTRSVSEGPRRKSLFFAGLVEEPMKGFAVLQEACQRLWSAGWDFEVVATGEPTNHHDARTRFIGWLSQEDLPSAMRRSDIVVCPTLAEEALGRTAVEARGRQLNFFWTDFGAGTLAYAGIVPVKTATYEDVTFTNRDATFHADDDCRLLGTGMDGFELVVGFAFGFEANRRHSQGGGQSSSAL